MSQFEHLKQENEQLKKFLSMDFRYSLFYIKSATNLLKESENIHPKLQAELLQGIAIAVDKSIAIMDETNQQVAS